MYRRSNIYFKMKNFLFFVIIILNIFIYNWMINEDIKSENSKAIISDAFAEEYDSIDNIFIAAINFTMPVIDVGFKTQGYSGKDLTIASILNINIKEPLNILKFQVPVLSQLNLKSDAKNTSAIQESETQKNDTENLTKSNADSTMTNMQELGKSVNTNAKITDKPYILIYHTHTMESYAATSKNKYIATYGYDRTNNLNFTVAKVGDYLADYLVNDYGIGVLHDKTINDYNYDSSYSQSLKTVSNILKKNPSIKVAIDLHRDGYGAVMKPGVDSIPVLDRLPNQDYRNKYVMEINGEKVARILFIIGSRRTKDMNEDWKKNYEFAKQISDNLNELYPGLSLGIEVKPYSEYNQHLLEKAILIELGSNYNTLEEAIASTKYLAKAINNVIKETDLDN